MWPITNFDRRGKGLHCYCKPCRRAMARAYKKRNRPAMKASLQKWQHEHSERTKELRRNHYLANTEKEKQRSKLWRQQHPVLRRAYQRMRYVKTQGHRLTDEEWSEVLQAYGTRCLRCGTENDITVDHIIPVSKGGQDIKENVQPLCRACNTKKKQQNTDYRPDKGVRWKEVHA